MLCNYIDNELDDQNKINMSTNNAEYKQYNRINGGWMVEMKE